MQYLDKYERLSFLVITFKFSNMLQLIELAKKLLALYFDLYSIHKSSIGGVITINLHELPLWHRIIFASSNYHSWWSTKSSLINDCQYTFYSKMIQNIILCKAKCTRIFTTRNGDYLSSLSFYVKGIRWATIRLDSLNRKFMMR